MDELENQEILDVEDIMKEFSGMDDSDETLSQALDEMPIAQEPPLEERLRALRQWSSPEGDEDVKRFVPQTKQADPAVDGQTRRIDPEAIRAALEQEDAKEFDPGSVSGDTVRFEPVAAEEPDLSGDTIRFTPLGEEAPEKTEEAEVYEPLGDETAASEVFTEDWEPQYEAPMGEYVPPEPIAFRPRSRLSELKADLQAGPEKRYHQLSELGVGKLQAAIFLSVLVVVLSFSAVAMNAFGMVQPDRMRLLVFGELFAIILSALLGSHQIIEGIFSLFRGKFTPDAMLALTFGVCLADGVFCLRDIRVPFCAPFCLMVTLSLMAQYQRRTTELSRMDTLRRANILNRIAKAPNCYDKLPGFYVTEGQVADLADGETGTTGPEKAIGIYCLLAVMTCAAIGAAAGLFRGVGEGLHAWSAAMLAATPVTLFISQTRPASVLERRFHRLGVVLCGWKGVKAARGRAAVPLYDRDLFPVGSVKINGVKFYSARNPDHTVACAAAVMERAGNALTPLFAALLESRSGIHYEVENYRSYDKLGLGGEVEGIGVLMGSARFLQDMGVDIPEGNQVNQAVYIAIDGELCGVFALAFGKLKGVGAGLATLCGEKGLTQVMIGDNFLVSEGFLRGKFNVNTRRVAFPDAGQRQEVEGWIPDPEESQVCALTTQEGLASVGFAISGARALYSACAMGAALHITGGIIGMALVLALTLMGAGGLLTPLNLVLFHLVWSIPGILVSAWTRYI